jgi:hypothetical protein
MPIQIALVLVLVLVLSFAGCGAKDDVVKACIKSTACGVKAYPRVSDCVDGYRNLIVPSGQAPVYDAIYACVVAAADCAGVRGCHGGGGACDNSYQASCAGGRAQLCDLLDKRVYSLDCGGQGLGCEVKSVGGYSFDAACTGPAGEGQAGAVDCGGDACTRSGQGCATGNDFDRCAGEKLESCLGNEWVSFDCGKLGLGPCVPATIAAACGAI